MTSSKPVNLFSRTTQSIVYNFKAEPVQRMLDFDYVCRRETASIAAVVTPGSKKGNHKVFFGTSEIFVPIYGSLEEAAIHHSNADILINYASLRSATTSSLIALEKIPTIKVVVIIAEGVPESETRQMIAAAKRHGKVVIGPATVGGVQAGAFKVGDTAGTIDNIIACKLYRPGSVGFISKSGGLSNECYNLLAKTTDGLYEGIAIGGDVFPGSTFTDHIIRMQQMDPIKMIVLLGELGGTDEYGVVEALKSGKITKPVVAWVSGTCAALFPTEVQFGHAGAKSGKDLESAHSKNKALKDAGAIVPTSFEGFSAAISTTYKALVEKGIITPRDEPEPPELPINFNLALSEGRVRRATGIVSTICDDRGEQPTYGGVPISEIIAGGNREANSSAEEKKQTGSNEQTQEAHPPGEGSIGDVIGLLWFKRRFPPFGSRFIELVLMLVADHGPCVSGAHNTIVAARAGKDLVSCVASGMLTIGPRFGGAIDDAARCFKGALDAKLTPEGFVEDMKKKGTVIPGIGHRIKQNHDERVLIMRAYAEKNFPSTRYLNFALEVSKITLQKAANLVLNVDGCIAALFLDFMESCAAFTKVEIDEIVEIGYLNGLFILARTIGLVGHALDQKRLKQPLYRHPWDDVMYG